MTNDKSVYDAYAWLIFSSNRTRGISEGSGHVSGFEGVQFLIFKVGICFLETCSQPLYLNHQHLWCMKILWENMHGLRFAYIFLEFPGKHNVYPFFYWCYWHAK